MVGRDQHQCQVMVSQICDDGKSRKIDSHYFSKLDELREEKINQILDF